MPGVDLSMTAFISPGGQVVRLAPVGDLAALTAQVDTVGTISTVTLTPEGGRTYGYDLDRVRWQITPSPKTYAKASAVGQVATFRSDATNGVSQLVAFVPTSKGEQKIALTVTHGTVSTVQNLFKKTTTYGAESLKIETSFWFGVAKTALPVRLVRTMSPGVPSERTVIKATTMDFPAGVGVTLSEPVTFPKVTGSTGAGYEFRWEVDVSPSELVHSRQLPMWVFGDDPTCAPQPLSKAPPSSAITYPAIYQRKATDTPAITPAAGKVYQDYVDRFVALWRATGLQGAWLSFNDYFANIYWVDLDDATIPRYDIKHWDIQGWGYDMGGWYGTDTTSGPYARTKVAVGVPIPNNVSPSVGTDRSLCIVGMRAGKIETIWEMWVSMKFGDGHWEAGTIGKTNLAEDWRHSTNYTTAAAGISALAYAFRVVEAQDAVAYVRSERAAGRVPDEAVIAAKVPHSFALNMPNPSAAGFSYPATHSDGDDPTVTTPLEGQKIYLKPTFDVAAMNYPPRTHVIGVIGKRRGWLVTDRTNYSTTMIVEGDQSYGGTQWAALGEPGERWDLPFPADQFVIGRTYRSRAEWDADTKPA